MIKEIEIKNFKCIDNLKLKCKNLNLLIGTNSSGKSTICQALLFLGQNIEDRVGLNGTLVSLGEVEENKCRYSNKKEIEVSVEDSLGTRISRKIRKNPETNKPELGIPYGFDLEERKLFAEKLSMRTRMIQYLSCHRVGPQNLYKKNMNIDELLGNNGEYAISYLNNHGDDMLEESLRREMNDFTLLGQVNWWLKYIVDAEISTEEISGADAVKASYKMNMLSGIRPGNIGSGVSYLVSMLILCLSAPSEAILVIENPEIHLHPAAQSRVCEFLYFIASSGRQLFVESHSDHIFNGFRAGLSNEKMSKEIVNIQFVSLNEQNVSEAMEVEIGRYGNVNNQRKYLFDQFDIDLNKMIGV